MKSSKFSFLIVAVLIGVPVVVFAAGTWTEPTATAPDGNVNGPVWLSPSTFQVGDAKLNGDIYLSQGKALKVDSNTSQTVLNLGNYGTNKAFSLNVKGDIIVSNLNAGTSTGKISAPLLCIGTDCRNAWPAGGGGSGDLTEVQAGTGITVTNGTGPIPTISANFTTTQARISSSCSAGYSIRSIDAAGGITCEYDDTGISSESDPQVGTLSSGGWCTSNGSTITCSSAAPTVTETDPQVGAVSSGQWCKGSGSSVECSYAAPTVTETDPQVGTLTSGEVCVAVGGVIQCSSSAANKPNEVCAVNSAVGGMAKLGGNAYSGRLYLSPSATSCSDSGWSFIPYGTERSLHFSDDNGNLLLTVYNANVNVYKFDSSRRWRSAEWAITSDARLKNIKKDYISGLSIVNALDPKVFTWKSEEKDMGSKAPINVGFIAQDVRRVLPEAVTATPGDNSGLEGGQLSINTTPIIAASVNAIQELSVENDALKDEISDLKARLSAIEAKLK